MTDSSTGTRSAIVEREFPHPPEKLWRALTQPHLIEEWLMKNDFSPEVGRPFTLRTNPMPGWNGVIECEVLEVEPNETLAYTWVSGEGALAVESVVTLTLTPTGAGTLLRMEQSGFPADATQNFQGAKYGWQAFLGKLDQLLGRID